MLGSIKSILSYPYRMYRYFKLRTPVLELRLYSYLSLIAKKWQSKLGLDYYANTDFRYFLPDLSLGFIAVPKVMTTSIKTALLGKQKLDRPHRAFAKSPKVKTAVLNPEDYVIVTFVRNPFSRLVSCYIDQVSKAKKSAGDRGPFLRYLGGFISDSKDFSDFVQRVLVIPDEFADMHFKSQHSIIYDIGLKSMKGRKEPDFIGHFEQVNQDWAVLQDRFELADLPRRNRSKKVKTDWRDYYDLKTAELVYKRYQKDVEAFGYEEDYHQLMAYLLEKEGKRDV